MPTTLSAAELRRRLQDRSLSAIEVAQAHLDRIDAHDAGLGCFLTVDHEGALEAARAAQTALDRGDAGPLAGVPVVLKDNLSTQGLRTTCASKMLDTYVPPYDATVVERLRNAGAVILGKTNLDEFAMGTSTENSAYFPTRNPWDADRSPGGSSGGTAAAVSAGFAPLGLGSDTGGSVRQPAALCGVVGYKPTYGRCSRYGLVAFASSLDQVGPMARSVEDAALLAAVITGHDSRDSTSLPDGPVAPDLRNGTLRGKRLGIPRGWLAKGTQPGVLEAFEAALAVLQSEGAELVDVDLSSARYGVTTYYIIAPAEASSNLARFDGVRYGVRVEQSGDGHIEMVERSRGQGFGHEVKARIMVGTYALSAGYCDAYYVRAQRVRARMRDEFRACLEGVDCVVSPTSPVVAFPLGSLTQDTLAMKMLDIFTIPANLGGFPGISLNCGFSEGLPVGLQLVGPTGGDEALLQMAHAVEAALPHATARPPVP